MKRVRGFSVTQLMNPDKVEKTELTEQCRYQPLWDGNEINISQKKNKYMYINKLASPP